LQISNYNLIYTVKNKMLILTYSRTVDFLKRKNIKINTKILFLIFLHVSESPLYDYKLKLIFYFLQCI